MTWRCLDCNWRGNPPDVEDDHRACPRCKSSHVRQDRPAAVLKPSLPYRLRRIVNEYGRPCVACGNKTLHQVLGVPVCVDCETEAIREIRKEKIHAGGGEAEL